MLLLCQAVAPIASATAPIKLPVSFECLFGICWLSRSRYVPPLGNHWPRPDSRADPVAPVSACQNAASLCPSLGQAARRRGWTKQAGRCGPPDGERRSASFS